jgi:hypothetical protein
MTQNKGEPPLVLVYYSRAKGQSTVHTEDGWLQREPFTDPDEAFDALLKRWRAGDLEARLSMSSDPDITLNIQYDYTHTLNSHEVGTIIKDLYDERIAYLVEEVNA